MWIALLRSPDAKRMGDLQSDIKALFIPRGTIKPARDMEIVKVGRSTGETTGTIKDIHFRFITEYEGVGKVGFLDQVFCTRYSNGGDSGSLVLDRKTKKAVGLHFAGFPDKNGVMGSVFNPIDQVLEALGATLVTKQSPKPPIYKWLLKQKRTRRANNTLIT